MKKHFVACLLCLTLAACALATPAFAQTPQAAAQGRSLLTMAE